MSCIKGGSVKHAMISTAGWRCDQNTHGGDRDHANRKCHGEVLRWNRPGVKKGLISSKFSPAKENLPIPGMQHPSAFRSHSSVAQKSGAERITLLSKTNKKLHSRAHNHHIPKSDTVLDRYQPVFRGLFPGPEKNSFQPPVKYPPAVRRNG